MFENKYEGQWIDDKKTGKGILYQNNIMVYKGEWLNDSFHGFGELYFPNGKLYYQGDWNSNKKNGNGIQYYKNGNMQYQGLWLNGQKTYGKYYDNEGTLLFNGLYQNLNNEMKEFIEKETKKDFFITSPIKIKSPKNIKSEINSNLDKQNLQSNLTQKNEAKSVSKSNVNQQSGYVDMITNFFKKYI